MKRSRFRERQPKTPHSRSGAANTRPVPRNEIPRTALRDRTREIHCHSAATPAGRAQTKPQRGHARKTRETGKYGRRKGPDLRPGPGAHALGRLPWLAGFPARERRLRPRRLIVAPQIDCAPERHTTDRKCISRRRRPLCAATTASRPIRPAHPPRHGRPVKPHPVQLWSSCFSRPAPLVLRLFPVAPKRPARSPAPTAGKNRGAPENAKRRDAFLPFTEEHFAWKTLYAQERPTREGCPQAELCTPVLV